MRWIGLNDGYVSGDGRFLVAQVTVSGSRGERQRWALHGLVHLPGGLWAWTDEPLHGPVDTKRACQEWALSSGYAPPTLGQAPTRERPDRVDRPKGYEICEECGVHYHRKDGHLFEDYCGDNCYAIVVERIAEIQTNLRKRGRAS